MTLRFARDLRQCESAIAPLALMRMARPVAGRGRT